MNESITIKDFPPPLRCADEVQLAHDAFVGMLLGDVPMAVPKEGIPYVHAAADVLRWVLKHEHNQTFARNLAGILRVLEERGFRMERRNN
jgi:hypothetical protein